MCDSRSTGQTPFRPSELPLQVCYGFDSDHVWRLCRNCRQDYQKSFKTWDLMNPRWQADSIWISENLFLENADIQSLVSLEGEIWNDSWRCSMLEARKLALKVHGGWLGINAVKKNVSSKLQARYLERQSSLVSQAQSSSSCGEASSAITTSNQ